MAGIPVKTPWDAAGWTHFYESHRSKTEDIYPSEWLFLKDILREDVSVLDIGCAVGGLASVLSEHLERFQYVGVDISTPMIDRAKEKHPEHAFHAIEEADLSVLQDRKFDLVVCLGVLHLSRKWRQLIAAAWGHVEGCLLLDLRETSGPSVENEKLSYYRVDQFESNVELRLPYNVINCAESLATLLEICPGAAGLSHYGYLASPSSGTVTPVQHMLMNTYRIDRRPASIQNSDR